MIRECEGCRKEFDNLRMPMCRSCYARQTLAVIAEPSPFLPLDGFLTRHTHPSEVVYAGDNHDDARHAEWNTADRMYQEGREHYYVYTIDNYGRELASVSR